MPQKLLHHKHIHQEKRNPRHPNLQKRVLSQKLEPEREREPRALRGEPRGEQREPAAPRQVAAREDEGEEGEVLDEVLDGADLVEGHEDEGLQEEAELDVGVVAEGEGEEEDRLGEEC